MPGDDYGWIRTQIREESGLRGEPGAGRRSADALVRRRHSGFDLGLSTAEEAFLRSAAACRSCVCEDNRIEGGCCCQDRGWACGACAGRAAGTTTVLLRPDAAVAARGQLPVGVGQRASEAQRVEHRLAWTGPHAPPSDA